MGRKGSKLSKQTYTDANHPAKEEGTYIEACNCEAACPCIFLSPPTEGECKVVVGWHVDKGRHGDTSLDGLNAALIVYTPGNMKDGQWKVALYLDERGNDEQRTALQGIFLGDDGGHIANLGPLIADVLGARPARITFDKGANARFRFEVDGAASTEMEPIQGQGGGTTEIKVIRLPYRLASRSPCPVHPT